MAAKLDLYILILTVTITSSAQFIPASGRQLSSGTAKNLNPIAAPRPFGYDGCPFCDVSVYSYCTNKLHHDACCCSAGNIPFHCPPADCSYLFANSCYEYSLISTCCCNHPY